MSDNKAGEVPESGIQIGNLDTPEITEKEYRFIEQRPSEEELKNLPERFQSSRPAPLVLLFGWAGSSDKNLGKYSELYRRAGCTTVQYSLPSRHIFRDTAQVPDLMSHLYSSLVSHNLSRHPTFIHSLSDTGVLCYQGLSLALARQGAELDIRGVVWDSCPGPCPEVTLPRIMAILIVNWVCCMRDGTGAVRGVHNSWRLLRDRVWPNYLRKLKGLPVELNFTGGEWYGHFGRDHPPPTPELFLYSKTDFYLPWRYLEEEVLSLREGRDSKAVRWDKSSHVSHYKTHKQEYANHVLDFVYEKYYCMEEEVEEERTKHKQYIGQL